MRTHLPLKYTWTDSQLTDAVRGSACWRDVVRALGIPTNSEGVIRRVKRDAARLDLDVSHFKGTRTWDDLQLRRAVADAQSWTDVFAALGLQTPRKETRVRVAGHAIRLGLDVRFLDPRGERATSGPTWQVDPMRLRDCATPLAAAWFKLRGCTVSFPEEGAIYDLLADSPEQGMLRVQVKSSIHKPDAAKTVFVARRPYTAGNVAPRMPYDPKVIDYFFIVDGAYDMYLIPSSVIAGRVGILLRAYKEYIVGNAGGLRGVAAEAADTRMRARREVVAQG
jgi:PD-(D/E)XK nuclease superfamily protein